MRIVFMGTPDFAVPALRALLDAHEVSLVVTQPDKPAGRKKKLQAPPVKELAIEQGIPVYQPRSARTPEFLERVQAAQAEVAVVVAYGKILPAAVLEAFPLGCINIHGSLLPKYRGAAPIQWAVINGDTQTGVSIMRLDEGMDTGPVLLSKVVPIGEDDTAGSLFETLAPLGAAAVLEALAGLADGSINAQPQSAEGASHAAMLTKQDGIVDWRLPAARLAARIRGLDPWPGAFTPFEGGSLKLFAARADESASEDAAPGTVLGYDEAGLRVATGLGVCCIREVQAPGKRRMAAADFARGRRLAIGSMLPDEEA